VWESLGVCKGREVQDKREVLLGIQVTQMRMRILTFETAALRPFCGNVWRGIYGWKAYDPENLFNASRASSSSISRVMVPSTACI